MNEFQTNHLGTAPTVIAQYHSDGLPDEYVGNPLIEALPGLLSDVNVIKALREKPDFKEEERQAEPDVRIHYLQRLTWQFFQPMNQHMLIWQYLALNIRQGYIQRNPLQKDSVILANELYAAAMENREPAFRRPRMPVPKGLAILGVSGVGKSTSLEKMLQLFPQVIQHNEYNQKELEMKQIVWMKLDCSHNGSERGFCLSFLNQIDRLVGTRYFETYEKRATVDKLLNVMARIASAYSIGIICVDEIQHLAGSRNGTEKLLNFFVTMENMIGVPVILMGTPAATPLFQGEFRQARRVCTHGSILWEPLQWDESITNSEWEMFLSRMWGYQWLQYPQKLDIAFVKAMYEETQGIEALTVILFILIQEHAIRSGKETFDVADIHSVAQSDMKLVQPMLTALRSKDERKMAQYQDIFAGFISDFYHGRKPEYTESSRKKQPLNDLIDYLTELEFLPEVAEKAAAKVLEMYPKESKAVQIRKALEMLQQKAENTNASI